MVISLGEFDLGFSEGVEEEVNIEQGEVIQEFIVILKVRHDFL